MSAQQSSSSAGATASKNGGIMAIAMLVGRILGLLRDTVLSSHFGLGLDADSFKIAVAVPDTIFMLVAGGGLSSAFIPIFGDFIYKDKRKEAWAAFSAVICLSSVAAISLIVVAWYFTPQIIAVFSSHKGPKFDPSVAIHMSRILLPGQFAFLIGSIMIATLYVRKEFWVGGLAPNIYNLCMVLAGMLLPLVAGLGIESMAWGALAGAVIGNLILPISVMLTNGSHFTPNFNLKTPGVDRFFRLLLPVIFGFSLPSMVTLITTGFASAYGGDGVNMALGSANNLMQAPLGIFGQSLALGVFPVLAQFVATNRMDLYRTQISKTLRTVLYLGIPSGSLMLALAPQIVRCLYGYGVASSDSVHQNAISDCLRLYSVGIFLWCTQPVLMRGFFSLHKTFKPIAVSTVMTIVFVGLCLLSIHVSPDFRLVPIATDVAILLLVVSLYVSLEKEVGKLDRAGITATVLLCGGASLVAGAVSFGLMSVFHPGRKIAEIALLFFVGTVGAWVYYFLTRLMKIPETEYVDKVFARAKSKLSR